jgi:hypothetical protein
MRKKSGIGAISMKSFLDHAAFDADTTTMLASVFDAAWERIEKSGSPLAAKENAVAARERLARHIIEAAKAGQGDPKHLIEDALAHLDASK